MEHNVRTLLDEHLKNIDYVVRSTLERLEPFYSSGIAVNYPNFFNDIQEITVNRVNQVTKCFEVGLKMKTSTNAASVFSYANTLKRDKNEQENVSETKPQQLDENNGNTSKNVDLLETASISSTKTDAELMDPLDELKGQRTLLSSLHIYGIPEEFMKSEENQTILFKRLCKKLKAKVSDKDIERTYLKKNALIVKMFQADAKDKILNCAADQDVWTNDLYELPKGQDPSRVKICHYMTPFYSKMWFTAEKFQNQGRLHSFKLNEKGLVVFRKKSSNERTVLTEQELIDYVKS